MKIKQILFHFTSNVSISKSFLCEVYTADERGEKCYENDLREMMKKSLCRAQVEFSFFFFGA